MERRNRPQESGYHPVGAEFDKDAPYNQEEVEQEVIVSLTISKKFKVKVYRDSTDADILIRIPEVISLENNLQDNSWSIDEEAVVDNE